MDIDIDCQTSFDPKTIFDVVYASQVKQGKLVKHPCGTYFQAIPVDQITGLSAIPFNAAEQLQYTKIDFLHLSVLDYFTSKDEIRKLSKIPPDWRLLDNRNVVSKLFQLGNHFDVISKVKPQSINDLADCVALIRPGKRQLISSYLKNKQLVQQYLYRTEDDDKSSFRRGHAIAYGICIVLQLHLIKGGIL